MVLKIQKVLINVNENDAVTDWVLCIENLKPHIRWKRTQVAVFDALKENLEENEILLQRDYSKNYKNLTKSKVHTVDIRASVSTVLAVIIGQKEWSTNTQ